jgi:hypothetical protein
VITKSRIALSKINRFRVFPIYVQRQPDSIYRTDWLAGEPGREEHFGNSEAAVSRDVQDMAFGKPVKQVFAQFCKIFVARNQTFTDLGSARLAHNAGPARSFGAPAKRTSIRVTS